MLYGKELYSNKGQLFQKMVRSGITKKQNEKLNSHRLDFIMIHSFYQFSEIETQEAQKSLSVFVDKRDLMVKSDILCESDP